MGNQILNFHKNPHDYSGKYSQIYKKQQKTLQNQSQSHIQQWQLSWKDITHQNIYYRRQYGKFNIYRNQITSQQIERYKTILFNKKQYQTWKEIVQWRNHNQYTVKVEHFQIHNHKQLCVSEYQMNIFMERVPLRLADLTDIPYPQNLYFLLATVKGFKYLLSYPFTIKNIQVTQSMICVNRQGLIKVWFNPNISQSEPAQVKNSKIITQQQVLKSIIDMIQENTDQKDYPYCFRQYLYDKKVIVNGDFNQIIQQIYSYAKDMRVTIPKCAYSVKDILNKDYSQTLKLEQQNSFSNPNLNLKRQQHTPVLHLQDRQSLNHRQAQNQIKYQNRPSVHQNQNGNHNTNINQKLPTKQEDNSFPLQKMYGLSKSNKKQEHPHNSVINNYNNIQKRQQSPDKIRFQNKQNQNQNRPQIIYPYDKDRQNLNNYAPIPVHAPQVHQEVSMHIPAHQVHQIGKNIFQYYPLQSQRINPPHFTNKNQIQTNVQHSINKRSNHQSLDAPPGYRRVQRKIIHQPYNNIPPNVHTNVEPNVHLNFIQNQSNYPHFPNVSPSNLSNFKVRNQNIKVNYSNAINNSNQHPIISNNNHPFINPEIQRVNSAQTTIRNNNLMRNEVVIQNQRIPQNVSNLYVRPATVRPQQISNVVNIQRISRQSSRNNFSNSDSKQNLNKTNSFKNNLIRNQHEDNFQTGGNLKYFTKKDSQETLDPQIAADLMKYMNSE